MRIPPRNSNHVDREQVLRAVRGLAASSTGNVTVVFKGLPKVGKTATATELMHLLGASYPDGQLFYRLSDTLDDAVSESDKLLEGLLALGDRREEIPDRADARWNRYLARTAGLRLLVVIDGATTERQVRVLRPADGESLVLVTERSPATDLSGGGVEVFELERLDAAAARELLVGIVGADRADAEPEAVDRLVSLCDNLPGALCIVGGMLRQQRGRSIGGLADRLGDERWRSRQVLSKVFDTAYRSLDELPARCYRAFGLRAHGGHVHPAAFSRALRVPEAEITWALQELADLHLVSEWDGGYHVAELVRVHARSVEQDPDDVRAEAETGLLRYYDESIGAADVLLAPARPWRALVLRASFPTTGTAEFRDADEARRWLRSHMANIAAAADYAYASGRDDTVARWCVLLWSFHEKDKNLDAMQVIHEHGVASARRSGNRAVESLLQMQLGFRHYWLRELDAAAAAFGEAMRLARELPRSAASVQLEASSLEGLGLAYITAGQTDAARDALRSNHRIATDIGDARRIALAALHLAKAEEPDRALTLLGEAEEIFDSLVSDETENRAKVWMWRGRKLVDAGRPHEARQPLLDALAVMRGRRRRFDEAEILVALGDCARAAGESEPERYGAALAIYRDLCFPDAVAEVESRLAGG